MSKVRAVALPLMPAREKWDSLSPRERRAMLDIYEDGYPILESTPWDNLPYWFTRAFGHWNDLSGSGR